MIRTIRLAILATMAALGAHAQAVPGPQLANTVPICATEGCTVKAISSPTAVLQFGAGANWNTLSAPTLTLPLLADCNAGCPQVGGDPAPYVVKSLVAQMQAAPYTVTLGNGKVILVPALPVVVKLSAIQIEPGSVPTWIAIYDVQSTGAAEGFEGKQMLLTIGPATYACQYVSEAAGVFTLSCTVQPAPAVN